MKFKALPLTSKPNIAPPAQWFGHSYCWKCDYCGNTNARKRKKCKTYGANRC